MDAYRMTYLPLSERRPFRLPTGWALFFSLISLIEKGKQRNDQSTWRYQQSQYTKKNHNDFIISHIRHLPSYVFRRTGFQKPGGYHPVMGTFRNRILPYRLIHFNNSIFHDRKIFLTSCKKDFFLANPYKLSYKKGCNAYIFTLQPSWFVFTYFTLINSSKIFCVNSFCCVPVR